MIRITATVLVSAALLIGIALPVAAHEGEDHEHSATLAQTSPTPEERRAEALRKLQEKKQQLAERQQALEDKRAAIKERLVGKLDEVKKRTCQQRTETIKKIMANASRVGGQHLGYFEKALARIQDFYVSKDLTVANYDDLVAAVNSKKVAAQAAIDAVKANTDFNCDGDNPVGTIDAFNGQVKAMHTALKEYRAALKELLVAVKTAAEAKEQV